VLFVSFTVISTVSNQSFFASFISPRFGAMNNINEDDVPALNLSCGSNGSGNSDGNGNANNGKSRSRSGSIGLDFLASLAPSDTPYNSMAANETVNVRERSGSIGSYSSYTSYTSASQEAAEEAVRSSLIRGESR